MIDLTTICIFCLEELPVEKFGEFKLDERWFVVYACDDCANAPAPYRAALHRAIYVPLANLRKLVPAN